MTVAAFRTEHASPHATERIRDATERRLLETVARGPQAINARLRELDEEWDIDRALETMAASAVLTGVALGATVSRKFLVLPGLVAAFLLQHTLQGWCPPLPVLRALGVRTAREIEQERYALKASRGDFEDVQVLGPSATAVLAVAATDIR